jgi:hypothetical protein
MMSNLFCTGFRAWLMGLLVLFHGPLFSPELSGQSTFRVEGQLLSIDPLQQVYTRDSLQTLRKYSPRGALLFTYYNRSLGPLQSCDASDPFAPVLFYPDFNYLVLLDRSLNPLDEVALEAMDIWGAQAVANSRDQQIWVYDQQDFTLKKISRQGLLSEKSRNLSRWVSNDWEAERIVVQRDALFLVSPRQDLLHFSPFGQYLRTLQLREDRFHFQQDQLYYCSDEAGLFTWEPIRGKGDYIVSLATPPDHLLARPQLLVIQRGNQVEVIPFGLK